MPILDLSVLPGALAVCRLDASALLPGWPLSGAFWAATRTAEELSIVCEANVVPSGIPASRPWRAIRVAGPLDFALTGILSSIAAPLAERGVSIFALSTYDTDYVLVRQESLERAVAALTAAGHRFPESAR